MRVLLVDDERLALTALANVLSARSDVEHFDSANDAVELDGHITTSQKWILQETTLEAQHQRREDRKHSRR
jgi:DNA-binding NarL/FixJ family response regulator